MLAKQAKQPIRDINVLKPITITTEYNSTFKGAGPPDGTIATHHYSVYQHTLRFLRL